MVPYRFQVHAWALKGFPYHDFAVSQIDSQNWGHVPSLITIHSGVWTINPFDGHLVLKESYMGPVGTRLTETVRNAQSRDGRDSCQGNACVELRVERLSHVVW